MALVHDTSHSTSIRNKMQVARKGKYKLLLRKEQKNQGGPTNLSALGQTPFNEESAKLDLRH